MKVKYFVWEVKMAIGEIVRYRHYGESKKAVIGNVRDDAAGYSIDLSKKRFVLDVQITEIPYIDNNLRLKQIYKLVVF